MENVGKKETNLLSGAELVSRLEALFSPLTEKHGNIVRVVFVAGSCLRPDRTPSSDIDITILVDDTREDYSPRSMAEIKNTIQEIEKKGAQEGLNLHVQPPRELSLYWDLIRRGEPWVLSQLREAVPVYDPTGFLSPIRVLVEKGRLAGLDERAYRLLDEAPVLIKKLEKIFLEEVVSQLVEAMVDSARAVLLFVGVPPPTLRELPGAMREKFVSEGLLAEEDVRDLEDIIELERRIEHGSVTRISGEEVDRLIDRAARFVKKMEDLFEEIDRKRKKGLLEVSYVEAMAEIKRALSRKGVDVPEDEDELLERFRKVFVENGMVPRETIDIVEKIRNTLKRGREKGWDLPEDDVYSSVTRVSVLRRLLAGENDERKE